MTRRDKDKIGLVVASLIGCAMAYCPNVFVSFIGAATCLLVLIVWVASL